MQIGMGFSTWAADHNGDFPMQRSVTNGGTMEMVQSGMAYIHFEVMSNELSTPRVLRCPADDQRSSASLFGGGMNDQNLSYFLGVDDRVGSPNSILSGDDNFIVNGATPKRGLLLLATNSSVAWTESRHAFQGNAALAHGSVQQFSRWRLVEALASTGAATNRFLMP